MTQANQSYQSYADFAALIGKARAVSNSRGAGWWKVYNPKGVLLRDMTSAQLEALIASPEPPPPPPTRKDKLRRLAVRYKRAAAQGNITAQDRAASAIVDLVLA